MTRVAIKSPAAWYRLSPWAESEDCKDARADSTREPWELMACDTTGGSESWERLPSGERKSEQSPSPVGACSPHSPERLHTSFLLAIACLTSQAATFTDAAAKSNEILPYPPAFLRDSGHSPIAIPSLVCYLALQ
jgi:hypothetical protein